MHRRSFLLSTAGALAACSSESVSSPGLLRLQARSRDAAGAASETTLDWAADKTAIVVCDMWDNHWCVSSAERVAAMAPRMNDVLQAARGLGVRIVHAPSSVVDFYQDSPARARILAAPQIEPPVPILSWCHLEPEKEIQLPIDDSDGGCDDGEPAPETAVWTRQHPAIEIDDSDAISDDGQQVFNYFAQHGIKHVAMMGVHANMCVLGRSFAIRQMTKLGFGVVLVRDLTDAMYDPRDEPYVDHDRGTQLVVEHIERHWCPSVLSRDLTVAAGA